MKLADSFQSVNRAIQVIDAVARRSEEGAKLADIAKEAGLGRATAHRFLKSLVDNRYLEYDEASALYFLGIHVMALGAAAANRFGLARRAAASLTRLAERTADTVYLTLRIDDEAVCIGRQEGAFPIKTLTLRVGDRRPLGVGAGSLALLAFLEPAEIERRIDAQSARLAQFGIDAATLQGMVEISRRIGYSLNDGRIIPGMTAVAVPILAANGEPVAAISVAAISTRMDVARRENIVTWLRDEVAKLQTDLAPLLATATTSLRRDLLAGA